MAELTKQAEKTVKGLSLKVDQVARTDSVFNANQVQKVFNSTPKRWQYTRPGKGGGNWTYVKTSYVRKVLDGLFGFNWDFNVETGLAEAFEVAKATKMCVVKGVLTGRVKKDGQMVELQKTQFGRAEVKFKKDTQDPLDFGNDMKAASSDALKKCASLFGIAADIYEADEFQEIKIIGSDDDTDKDEATKNLVAAAKEKIGATGGAS